MSRAGREKHPDELVFRRGGRVKPMNIIDVEVDDDGNLVHLDEHGNVVPVPVPEPPEGLSEYALNRWRGFWLSPVSKLVRMETHGDALTRWIWLVHETEALRQLYMRQPFVNGAKAYLQPELDAEGNKVYRAAIVDNPAYRQWRDCDEKLQRYEEAFGMTPMAQLRLGVEFLVGRRIAKDLGDGPRGPRRPTMVRDEPR